MHGVTYRYGTPVQRACTNCKIHSPLSAQIQHFDQQQQEEARRARFLNKVINDKASTLAGGLSGK